MADIVAAGYRRTPEVLETDVVVDGAMKSGNTWFRFLVAGAVFGLDVTLAPPTAVYYLVPDIENDTVYERYDSTMFFKSHSLPRPEYRRVVYLLRDGRDVMVSMYHHLRAVRGEDGVDFLRMVRDGEGLSPCKWHEHVQAWTANPFGAGMITIRYEDLLADGVRELQRLCEFVGLERDRSTLQAALSNAGFERMRGMEATPGANPDPMWPADKRFLRRGEAGSHRDEMPPEVLAAFMAQAEDTLGETGYLAP